MAYLEMNPERFEIDLFQLLPLALGGFWVTLFLYIGPMFERNQ